MALARDGWAMTTLVDSRCSVCGSTDARGLVASALENGIAVTLCGTHAVMHARSTAGARSVVELRAQLSDRRNRRDRRYDGDELGAALTAAFATEQRRGDRRRG